MIYKRKDNPRIYIVLPVHNRIKTTRRFAECLLKQTYSNYHLVLVDDGSSDGTAEYVKGQIKRLTVLHGDGNLWWAGALYKAYRHLSKIDAAADDVVLITNDDITFAPDYFEKVINDRALEPETLIVSPGHSITTDFIERGYSVDWSKLQFYKLKKDQKPDALITRGLYMHYAAYLNLTPLRPWFLIPHYLSDLEYTIRADRRGYRLVVSENSHIYYNELSTGLHKDDSKTLKEFLYKNLISKKTAYNTFYWGNFALLVSPWRYKVKNFLITYLGFGRALMNFIRKKDVKE